MKLRNYLKSRLFLQYTLSYLIVLVLPLVLFASLIYQSAVGNLRGEVERSHLSQLTQAQNTVDSRIEELGTIASRIAYDARLAPYRVHDSYYSSEAIQALDQYKATSSIVGNLFLFFHGDDRIYSASGMSSLDVFKNQYSFHNWQPDVIVNDLNGTQFPTMRPADLVSRSASAESSLLAYLVPITPNSPSPHGTVMYFIDESEFNELISSVLGGYQGLTFVFDNNGHILTASQRGEALSLDDVQGLSNQSEGIHNLRLGGVSHSVVSVKSELNGWTYTTVMPSSQFFSSVVHVRSLIFLIFAAVITAGAAVALLMARRQYYPISDLAAFAQSHLRRPSPAGVETAAGELEQIRSVLRLSSRRAELQEPYARNHYLLTLLKYGGAETELPDLMQAFRLRFDLQHYTVLVLEWEQNHENQPPDSSLLEQLQEIHCPDLAALAYSVELSEPNRIALIVGLDPAAGMSLPEQIQDVIQQMRNMAGSGKSAPTIGIGTVYEGTDCLNQSYIEALSALDARMYSGPGSISYFTTLTEAEEQAYWLPPGLLIKLSHSLKQGSYDVAVPTIEECFVFLQASGASVPLIRAMCFDVLNAMLKTAAELNVVNISREIPPLPAYNSLEDLQSSFLRLASLICSQVQSNTRTEERSLLDRILLYIHEHYTDYSLSLESISQEYGVSSSHFSRSFKEKTGMNFTAYVWQMRINEVKRQLDVTSDPLKEIIQRVGYLDTPNFIRKFKKETGLTPGQYRKRGSVDEQEEREG